MTPPEKDASTADGDDDQSMEEILQSIKSIIAEEGDGAEPKKAKSNTKPEQSAEKTVKEEPAKNTKDETDQVPGSDVLELTEVLEEAVVEPSDMDVLSQIDEAVKPKEKAVKTEPAIAESVKKTAKPAAVEPSSSPGDPMLSEEAEASARASVEKLRRSSEPPPLVTTGFPEFSSGNSLEGIVAGMVRPMIKEWLDDNLPAIVERIVEQEIKRITR
ncbi:MAG: DUF2497 domain-containing protein [Alphaproteobacteria bacterium]